MDNIYIFGGSCHETYPNGTKKHHIFFLQTMNLPWKYPHLILSSNFWYELEPHTHYILWKYIFIPVQTIFRVTLNDASYFSEESPTIYSTQPKTSYIFMCLVPLPGILIGGEGVFSLSMTPKNPTKLISPTKLSWEIYACSTVLW